MVRQHGKECEVLSQHVTEVCSEQAGLVSLHRMSLVEDRVSIGTVPAREGLGCPSSVCQTSLVRHHGLDRTGLECHEVQSEIARLFSTDQRSWLVIEVRPAPAGTRPECHQSLAGSGMSTRSDLAWASMSYSVAKMEPGCQRSQAQGSSSTRWGASW